MPNPYRVLFAAPGTKAFSAAGLVARLPIPMTHMGILTMLSELRGEYGLASAVAAVFTLSMALIGPLISRLVDRRGQGRILLPAAGVGVLSLGALILAASTGAPAAVLFVLAVPSGLMPSMGAMVRARWTEIYRGTPQLHTAYSLESVLDELTYIIGPALVVMLSLTFFPEFGPLVSGLLLIIGVACFVPQKRTEPPVRRETPQDGPGAGAEKPASTLLRTPAVFSLAVTLLFLGTIPGTLDTVALAFADDQGSKGSAGWVFAAYALGSAVAGLTFGATRSRLRPPLMLQLAATGTALTTLPFLVVTHISWLSVAVFVSGALFAPTMIIVMSIVERFVPPAELTEGMTWMLAGVLVGTALGAAAAGQLVDRFGIRYGFLATVAAGFLTLLSALVSCRLLPPAADGVASPESRYGPESEPDHQDRNEATPERSSH